MSDGPGGGVSGEPRIRTLTRADGPRLRALGDACPVEADFTVVFERGADVFRWPDLVWERWRYAGAEVGDDLVGACSAGVTTGWTAMGAAPWFYLGDARVRAAWRGRRVIQRLFDHLAAGAWDDVDEGFGIVKTANRAGERTADLLCGHPRFAGAPAGRLTVALLPVLGGFRGDPAVTVRRAGPDDAERLAACHARFNGGRRFAPRLDADAVAGRLAPPGAAAWWLAERGGRVEGALAAWDMNAFHGARILRYAPSATLLRAAVAGLRLLRPGIAPFPAPGGHLRTLTTTAVAVGAPGVLRALLGAVAGSALGEGFHLLSVAFVGDDPLAPAVRGLPHQRFVSTIFHARRRGRPSAPLGRPYVDLAWI